MSTTEVSRPTRDNRDPALVDRLTADREVILLAHRGDLLTPDLPSARLRTYAGGGHGFLDQYAE